MSVARGVIAGISQGIGALRARPRSGLRILLYHSIGATPGGGGYDATVTAPAFEAQLRSLREGAGGAVVSLAAGLAAIRSGTLRGTAVAVTFDDGYLDTLTVAAPILARYEIPFTVFAVGSFLTRPPAAGRYLDVAALRELAAVPGAAVGGHGHSHRSLTQLDDAGLVDELERSAAAIADAIGRRPTMMSYPHGAVNRRVTRAAARCGYVLGASSLAGVNRPRVPLLRLRRTEITGADGAESFRGKVRGDYDWYQIKQRLYWPLPAARTV